MKAVFWVIGLVLITKVSFSQSTYTDSLDNLLKRASEKEQPRLLNLLAKAYSLNKVETAKVKSDKAFELAKKNKDTKELVNSLEIRSNIDIQEGNYEHGIMILKNSMTLIKETKNSERYIGQLMRFLAEVNLYKGDYDSSLVQFKAAISVFKKINDRDELVASLNGLASVYYYQGDYQKALSYYLENLALCESMGIKPAIAQALLNSGSIYFMDNNFTKAQEYYEKALIITTELKDKSESALVLDNIGSVYENTKAYDKALDYHLKSLEIREGLNDKVEIAQALQNIGNVYSYKKDVKKAFEYYEKSLKINEELGSKNGEAISLLNIGSLFLKAKLYSKAINYLEKGLKLATEIGRKELMKTAFENLGEVYNATGDYKKAYESQVHFNELKDTLLNEQRIKSMTEMSAKYETDKKEKEIKLLSKDKELQEQKAKQQSLFRNALILSVILLLSLAFLIYSRYKTKQRAHTELEAINFELEKLSLVASKTDNSVLIANENGELEWVNAAFTRLTGYTQLEFIEKFGKSVINYSASKNFEGLIKESVSKRTSVIYETQNYTKDGNLYWVQSTLTPIFDENSNLKKLVIIDSDITRRKADEDVIKSKNKDITDSINYAKQIQSAILPSHKHIVESFPKSFIIYQPKDIVSGDFYWHTQTIVNGKEAHYIAAVDCTGHGVPGAFMSMIGNDLLEQIVNVKKISDPGKILSELNIGIKQALHQTEDNASRDGMDIALCMLIGSADDNGIKTLFYAGAFRPLWLVNSSGELNEIRADKRAIGGLTELGYEFNTHEIKVSKGDAFYIFSDGYVDQFGGEKGKKYMSLNFKKLLLNIKDLSINDQKERIETDFEKWKNTHSQVDDVLVIGVKI